MGSNQKIHRLLPLLLLAAACAAQAQSTKVATVSATIADTCRFANGDVLQLALGSVDPGNPVAVQRTQSVGFACTNGYAINVGIEGTAGNLNAAPQARSLRNVSDENLTIAYQLSASLPKGSVGKGFGSGNELSLDLTASIQPADLQNAYSGIYQENVVVQLRP